MEIEHNGVLKDVLPEDLLELGDGKIVKNLRELVVMLEAMSNEDFGLHVYGEQNDFAEWILEAYWDERLTGKILGIRDRVKMISFLRKVLRKAEKEQGLKIVAPGKKQDILKSIGEIK